MFEPNTIVCAAALDFIKSLPDASVDCCITSPPYYGLRKYCDKVILRDDLTDDEMAYVESEMRKLGLWR